MVQNLKVETGLSYARAYEKTNVNRNGYHTNNQFQKFPPFMSDGRTVTASWQPNSEINDRLLQENNIQSNWQYRKFMIQNGNEIREQMFQNALNDNGYVPTSSISKTDFLASTGLSDLKDQYLTKEQLNSKMTIPSLTQAQVIQIQQQA